jgi:hypothetical protein
VSIDEDIEGYARIWDILDDDEEDYDEEDIE